MYKLWFDESAETPGARLKKLEPRLSPHSSQPSKPLLTAALQLVGQTTCIPSWARWFVYARVCAWSHTHTRTHLDLKSPPVTHFSLTPLCHAEEELWVCPPHAGERFANSTLIKLRMALLWKKCQYSSVTSVKVRMLYKGQLIFIFILSSGREECTQEHNVLIISELKYTAGHKCNYIMFSNPFLFHHLG